MIADDTVGWAIKLSNKWNQKQSIKIKEIRVVLT